MSVVVANDPILNVPLTNMQRKLLEILCDGQYHSIEDLHKNSHPLAKKQVIRVHLHYIRKKIRPYGRDIVSVLNWGGIKAYRQVICLDERYYEFTSKLMKEASA